MTVTNFYFNGRAFHVSDYRGYVTVNTIQGTTGPVPGIRTDVYPRTAR